VLKIFPSQVTSTTKTRISVSSCWVGYQWVCWW